MIVFARWKRRSRLRAIRADLDRITRELDIIRSILRAIEDAQG